MKLSGQYSNLMIAVQRILWEQLSLTFSAIELLGKQMDKVKALYLLFGLVRGRIPINKPMEYDIIFALLECTTSKPSFTHRIR